MNRPACKNHHGILIDKWPCPRCEPEAHLEARQRDLRERALQSQTKEKPVSTITQLHPQVEVDTSTGEIHDRRFAQPTLDPEMFPAAERKAVPYLKLALAGPLKLSRGQFDAACPGAIETGRRVTLTVTLEGYLPEPHASWVKRSVGAGKDKQSWWEKEGQLKVKVLDLVSLDAFELGGMYDDED